MWPAHLSETTRVQKSAHRLDTWAWVAPPGARSRAVGLPRLLPTNFPWVAGASPKEWRWHELGSNRSALM